MNKILGAVFVLTAGFWARWAELSERRRRRDMLASLADALDRMREEIRMTRTPMPELLGTMGERCKGETGTFFQCVAAGLDEGKLLGESWEQAAACIPLPREELAALAALGWHLAGDEEAACRALAAAGRQLERLLEEWDRQRPEAEKRATALWLSGSALLVILLI